MKLVFSERGGESVSYPDAKEAASETVGEKRDHDEGGDLVKAYHCEGSRVGDAVDAVRFFNGREVLTRGERIEE